MGKPSVLVTTDHPVLAIDHGTARIGLAATDDFALSIHPAGTLDAAGDPLTELEKVVVTRKVQTLVLGLPLRLDGSEGDSSARVREFADQLKERFPDLPLHFHDERFSTQTAAKNLRQAGKKARNQKEVIDQAAAMEILREFLGW